MVAEAIEQRARPPIHPVSTDSISVHHIDPTGPLPDAILKKVTVNNIAEYAAIFYDPATTGRKDENTVKQPVLPSPEIPVPTSLATRFVEDTNGVIQLVTQEFPIASISPGTNDRKISRRTFLLGATTSLLTTAGIFEVQQPLPAITLPEEKPVNSLLTMLNQKTETENTHEKNRLSENPVEAPGMPRIEDGYIYLDKTHADEYTQSYGALTIRITGQTKDQFLMLSPDGHVASHVELVQKDDDTQHYRMQIDPLDGLSLHYTTPDMQDIPELPIPNIYRASDHALPVRIISQESTVAQSTLDFMSVQLEKYADLFDGNVPDVWIRKNNTDTVLPFVVQEPPENPQVIQFSAEDILDDPTENPDFTFLTHVSKYLLSQRTYTKLVDGDRYTIPALDAMTTRLADLSGVLRSMPTLNVPQSWIDSINYDNTTIYQMMFDLSTYGEPFVQNYEMPMKPEHTLASFMYIMESKSLTDTFIRKYLALGYDTAYENNDMMTMLLEKEKDQQGVIELISSVLYNTVTNEEKQNLDDSFPGLKKIVGSLGLTSDLLRISPDR